MNNDSRTPQLTLEIMKTVFGLLVLLAADVYMGWSAYVVWRWPQRYFDMQRSRYSFLSKRIAAHLAESLLGLWAVRIVYAAAWLGLTYLILGFVVVNLFTK